jgi:hypothetical protein
VYSPSIKQRSYAPQSDQYPAGSVVDVVVVVGHASVLHGFDLVSVSEPPSMSEQSPWTHVRHRGW